MIVKPTKENIEFAAELLRKGGLVAIPTETVYGLAADASNENALRKIFQLKGRPTNHPVIVHVSSDDKLTQLAVDIPEIAYKLTQNFWPGPLTLILKRNAKVLDIITGGQNTVGIRSPDHNVTLDLLKTFDGVVAAPSANKFGNVSPTTAFHVEQEFGNNVDMILDGGNCIIGVESTILDLSSKNIKILRPGMISKKEIELIINEPVYCNINNNDLAPRVSGSLKSHYSPNTLLHLMDFNAITNSIIFSKEKDKISVVSFHEIPDEFKNNKKITAWVVMSSNAKNYARLLYGTLRDLDSLNSDIILVEQPPQNSGWIAINDRLNRASKEKE